MKKHILLLLLSAALLGSTRSAAQPYQSIFGKDSTMWTSFTSCGPGAGGIFVNYRTFAHKKVNGKLYWAITSVLSLPGSDTFLIREDVSTGKVWFKYWCCKAGVDTNDILMIDFSMNIGDTIRLFNNLSPHVVDSIYYTNGLKNLRLIDDQNAIFYFKESVGCLTGLSYSVIGMCIAGEIACMKKDQTINYISPIPYLASECALQSNVSINDILREQISIVPNPAKSHIEIMGSQDLNTARYRVKDMLGKTLLSGDAGNRIDVSALPAGLYFIQIIANDEKQYFKFQKL